MPLFEVKNLKVQFHNQGIEKTAVDGVSFHVEKGEILGIAGASGSGKSTMMFALKGLPGKNAVVSYDGIFMEEGSKIGMVFQDPLSYLNPTMKIGKQLEETIRFHQNLKKTEVRKEALRLLEQAGIYRGEDVLIKYPFELSGGMRQRVILAIALAMKSALLIADEPTTALDVIVQRQILEQLRKAARENDMAVILVSHDLNVIGTLAQRVLIMKDGKVVEEGPIETIFDLPKHPYTKQLLEKRKNYGTFGIKDLAKESVLEVKGVKKSFKEGGLFHRLESKAAVRGVDFRILKGENYGLVGESGCGKTTLAKMITDVLRPDVGHVCYFGEKPMQMVFQDPFASLNPLQKIRDILEEPLVLNHVGTKKEREAKVEKMLTFIGLSIEAKDKYPFAFSGGERQRIGIARSLILEPELIVLDEPVSALDMVTQEQILELLSRFQKEKGISYLFISHDLSVVNRMTQRMSVMFAGRFVESGETRDVYADPWHPYTKKLLEASLQGNLKKLRKRAKVRGLDYEMVQVSDIGCPYAASCGYAMDCCKISVPGTYSYGEREISCFLYDPERFQNRSKDYRMVSQI